MDVGPAGKLGFVAASSESVEDGCQATAASCSTFYSGVQNVQVQVQAMFIFVFFLNFTQLTICSHRFVILLSWIARVDI